MMELQYLCAGLIIKETTCLPFGRTEIIPGQIITNNRRYSGKYFGEASGLYDNLHRH